jgi:hypothetical protein
MKKFFVVLFIVIVIWGCTNENIKRDLKDDNPKYSKFDVSFQDSIPKWTESEKQELNDMMQPMINPIIEKYGKLGKEFGDIYLSQIKSKFTWKSFSNVTKSELAEVFIQSINKTSPGWSFEAINNCKSSCIKNFGKQGITKNLDEFCDCFCQKVQNNYKNYLVANVMSQYDTITNNLASECMLEVAKKHMHEFFDEMDKEK